MIAKILDTADKIRAAQHLLYNTYYLEQGWEPEAGNPSGIIVCHQTKRFTDDFDNRAIWVGVIDAGKVIACGRLIPSSFGEEFELERYRSIPEFLKRAKSVEGNRVAVAKGYRMKSPASVLLFRSLLVVSHRQGAKYFFGATNSKIRDLYQRLGMSVVDEPPFRYSAQDKDECYISYGPLSSWWRRHLGHIRLSLAIKRYRGSAVVEKGDIDRF